MQRVNRDWGFYLVLRETPKTKWKILYFRRGAKLSLQRHFKREEKWYFLLGHGDFIRQQGSLDEGLIQGPMTIGDRVTVPVKCWHQYIAHEPTIVLEKQSGICEEEDIERA